MPKILKNNVPEITEFIYWPMLEFLGGKVLEADYLKYIHVYKIYDHRVNDNTRPKM